MPTGEVLRIVESIYREYVAEPDNYDSLEAYQTAKAFTNKMLEDLRIALSEAKDGKVFSLSERERRKKSQELEVQGKELIETVTEDDKEDSKE